MHRGWILAGAALAAIVLIVSLPASVRAAAPCDEYDPAAPARTARIVLGPSDFLDEERDELRSFVETGSLGRVDAAIVSSRPRGVVRSFFAGPKISRYSPYYGEALRGIALGVTLLPTKRPVTIVVRLRQTCAKFFRDSYLYY